MSSSEYSYRYSSGRSSDSKESNINNNKLNINKFKKKTDNLRIDINKSEIIQDKNINKNNNQNEGYSDKHISLNVKINVEKLMTEKILVNPKKNAQNVSEIISSSSRNSIKFIDFISNRIIIENIRKSLSSNYSNDSNSIRSSRNMNYNCLICDEELKNEELNNNILKCYHMFCNDCYYEYIKEKVNTNQINRIKCPKKNCDIILEDNFIERILIRDIPLLDKYKKLQAHRQLILNPNVQLCPFPDCESYAMKKEEDNYVSCIKNKHKFCFNCLKDWHGNKKCDDNIDKSFQKWRNSSKVKRCPKCKYFIEKNEGCNHITCSVCGYEFCWLCLGKYSSGHFDLGRCAGLQNVECEICQNRLINFLYQLLFIILKSIAFAICTPFVVIFFIYYSFFEECIKNYEDCPKIIFSISGVLSCLNFIMCGCTITTFISILMIFIWPFHDFIFSIIN